MTKLSLCEFLVPFMSVMSNSIIKEQTLSHRHVAYQRERQSKTRRTSVLHTHDSKTAPLVDVKGLLTFSTQPNSVYSFSRKCGHHSFTLLIIDLQLFLSFRIYHSLLPGEAKSRRKKQGRGKKCNKSGLSMARTNQETTRTPRARCTLILRVNG